MAGRIERKLISDVMSPHVHRVGVGASAGEALAVMQQNSVSSVLVIEDDLILGIITERDIVRACQRNLQLATMSCADLMASPVVCVEQTIRCLDAYHLMASRNIRHIAVTDSQGHVVGMASEGDVMRNFGLEYYMDFKEVRSVMATDVCTLAPDTPLAVALQAMIERHQSCVVVVDPKHRPMGVLSERDVVRLCRQEQSIGHLNVREVMHSPVITVKPRKRLHAAVRAMEDSHIRRLVVVDDKAAVIGLLTHHEIARGLEGDYAQYLKEILQLQARQYQATADVIDEKLLLANLLRSVSGSALIASDLDFRISYATPSVASVLGLRVEEMGGSDIRIALQKAGWADADACLRTAAQTQGMRRYKLLNGHSGTELQVSMLLNARNDPQGYLVLAQKAAG